MGVWQVPPNVQSPVAVVGMSPTRSVGLGGQTTFTFSDTNGLVNLSVINVLVNPYLDGVGACYLSYVRPSTLYLMNDAGTSFGTGKALNQAGVLQNSQCAINLAESTVVDDSDTNRTTLSLKNVIFSDEKTKAHCRN